MEKKFEDEVVCGTCKQVWLISVDKEGFATTMSELTGYMCAECAGNDPQDGTFPARKKS